MESSSRWRAAADGEQQLMENSSWWRKAADVDQLRGTNSQSVYSFTITDINS
jgi:hypothetical protein